MLISAFNTYLIKYCENIIYRRILFILAHLIKYNIAPVHHNKARAVLQGIAKIMRYHNSCKFFLLNHFIGKLHNYLRGLGVKCGGVLIKDKEVYRCQRCHNK